MDLGGRSMLRRHSRVHTNLSQGSRRCKEFQAAAFPRQLDLGASSPPPWFAAVLATAGGDGGEEKEDKMDMLWEDFNEELASVPPVCPLSPLIDKRGLPAATKEVWLHGDVIVAAGDAEKRVGRLLRACDGKVVRRRRWSFLLMLKLLKSLFHVKRTRNPRTTPI